MNARGPVFALTGALFGSLTGLLDGWIGQGATTNTLGSASAAPFLIYSAAVLVLPGVALSLLIWLGLIFARPIYSLKTVKNVFKKPFLLGALTILAAVGLLLAWVFVRARGIQVEAINYRPFILTIIALFGCTVSATFLSLRRKLAIGFVVVYCAASLGVAWAGTVNIGKAKGAIEILETNTSLLKLAFRGVKFFFDGDGDGFAEVVCETDCDCDDKNPNINPIALDLPGNGLDEDCSGLDLTLALAQQELESKGGSSSGSGRERKSHIEEPLNIVLITVDAMRADHVHSYGYERQTTPYIDRFAEDNVMFAQVRSQGPSTKHVFPVLLTGKYFSHLKLKKGKKWSKLLLANTTFAERLKERNYSTRAVLPYFRFKEHSGFNQGFDSWVTKLDPSRNPVWDPTGDLVTDRGITHLRELKKTNKPWFIWLHYFDPHGSYIAHTNQRSFGSSKADRYDGELLFVDSQIKRLFDNMKSLGLFDKTAVILTSDHGEGLGLPGDHGLNYHGFSLFDTEIRVPLIIRCPGAKKRIVEESVAVADIPLTIMELAGVESNENLDGASLVPYLFGENPKREPFLSELPGDRPMIALIDWPYKLIWNIRANRYQLFDLSNDPLEASDLSKKNPALVDQLKQRLRRQRVGKP